MRGGIREIRTNFSWGKVRVKDHLGDLEVNGRTVVKWVVQKQRMRMWIRLIWLMVGSCEYDNEPSGSIKREPLCLKFL
jgi:hypothetical protein